MDNIELHPIVAELAATMERSADKASVSFPNQALERTQSKLRATTDNEPVVHLIALAAKIKRIAGDGGLAAIVSIGLLIADKLGSAQAAADKLEGAGLAKEAQSFLGKVGETRAPRDDHKPPTPTVKAKRGLS